MKKTEKPGKEKSVKSPPKKIVQYFANSIFYQLSDDFTSTRDSSHGFPVIVEVDKKDYAVGHHLNGERRVYFDIKQLVAAYGIKGGDLLRLTDVPINWFEEVRKGIVINDNDDEEPKKSTTVDKKLGIEAKVPKIEKNLPSSPIPQPKQISLF